MPRPCNIICLFPKIFITIFEHAQIIKIITITHHLVNGQEDFFEKQIWKHNIGKIHELKCRKGKINSHTCKIVIN